MNLSDERMEKGTTLIGGRNCVIYKASRPECLLIQPVDSHDLEGLDDEVATIESLTMKPFVLVAFQVREWQHDLTPWAAPAVFCKAPFGDGASETLSFVNDVLLPELQKRQVYDVGTMKCLLGGYSLAGLFALWSCYQTQTFEGIAAVSPSVWFTGWMSYAEGHRPLASCVYLSLGDKEEKAKNPVMAKVGDCIRRQYELLMTQGYNAFLEWNPGNHFQHPAERTAKGFVWLMNRVS